MRGSAQRPLALFRPFLVFPHLFALEKLIPPPLFRKTSPFRPEKRVNIGFLQGIPRLPPLLLREKNTPFSLFRPPSALFAFGNEPRAKRRNMQERISDQSDGSDQSENIQERGPPTCPTCPTCPRTSKRENLRPVRPVRPVREHPRERTSDPSDLSDPSENIQKRKEKKNRKITIFAMSIKTRTK